MKSLIRNLETKILSDNWAMLKKLQYEFMRPDGKWETQVREVYDRGDGATILLFNQQTKKVILTRQFRIPTFLNGNEDGMLIETCAGKLDEVNPDDCIVREVLEETGYQLEKVERIFSAYMSPGSVTELIHFYLGEYDESMKVNEGGGKESEQENIEVMELDLDKAVEMTKNGEIRDGKTIMLIQHLALFGRMNK